MSKMIFLSHFLDEKTPSYGNRNVFRLESKRSMMCGDHANDSFLHMSVHQGTHSDMPIHFYENGQSIEDYPASFWVFDYPIVIEIKPKNEVIYQEVVNVINKLSDVVKKECDLLIVKTGIGLVRGLPEFWEKNPGFSPDLYPYFKTELPSLRVFGFDGISLTGFQNREIGKIAHRNFLNPEAPILLLEDMRLNEVSSLMQLDKVIVAPLLLKNSDGLPCTVIGFT